MAASKSRRTPRIPESTQTPTFTPMPEPPPPTAEELAKRKRDEDKAEVWKAIYTMPWYAGAGDGQKDREPAIVVWVKWTDANVKFVIKQVQAKVSTPILTHVAGTIRPL